MPGSQMELSQMGVGQTEVIEAKESTLVETLLMMQDLWQKQTTQFMGILQRFNPLQLTL